MIFLYRRPILDYWCESGEDLRRLVRHVLIHDVEIDDGLFGNFERERLRLCRHGDLVWLCSRRSTGLSRVLVPTASHHPRPASQSGRYSGAPLPKGWLSVTAVLTAREIRRLRLPASAAR